MKSALTLRNGYKTMTVILLEDGGWHITLHRPPQAWLEFTVSPEDIGKLTDWLQEQANGRT